MSIELPDAVATYFAIGNGGDPAPLSTCFAADANVRDEGRTHRGLPAIEEWVRSTRERYAVQAEPLSAVRDGDPLCVDARVSGNFPGSPVTLRFAFVLAADGRIASLEIG